MVDPAAVADTCSSLREGGDAASNSTSASSPAMTAREASGGGGGSPESSPSAPYRVPAALHTTVSVRVRGSPVTQVDLFGEALNEDMLLTMVSSRELGPVRSRGDAWWSPCCGGWSFSGAASRASGAASDWFETIFGDLHPEKIRETYKREWIRPDVVAGLTTGVMLVPQGVAFASLAGVPAVYGIYTSIYPIIVYSILGSSRHLHVGPFAIISLMVAQVCQSILGYSGPTTVEQAATADGQLYIAFAISLSLGSGLLLLAFGLLRLGSLAVLLSDPVVSAVICAASYGVLTSQVFSLLGISKPDYSDPLSIIRSWVYIFAHLEESDWRTCLVGFSAIAFLLLVRRFNLKCRQGKVPAPGELLAVVTYDVISYLAGLEDKGVKVVGTVPKGLIAPTIPNIGSLSFGEVLAGSIGIFIVSAVVSISIVKVFASKYSYKADVNRDLVALGVANLVGGFFSCYPSAGSLSRSAVVASVGGKTRLGLALSGVLVIFVALALTPLLKPLPFAVLAAIVCVALRGLLLQVKQGKALFLIQRWEGFVWAVAFVATILLGVLWGIVVALGTDLLVLLWRLGTHKWQTLGWVPSTTFYRDVARYSDLVTFPALRILCYNSDLLFFAAESFSRSLDLYAEELAREAEERGDKAAASSSGGIPEAVEPSPVVSASQRQQQQEEQQQKEGRDKGHHHFRCYIIVDFASVTRADTTSLKSFNEAIGKLKLKGVGLLLSGIKGNIRDIMQRYGTMELIGRHLLFPNIHSAVRFALKELDSAGVTLEEGD